MSNVLGTDVLVLNKAWVAFKVVRLRTALESYLCNFEKDERGNFIRDSKGELIPKARVVDPSRDFQQFTWDDWSKIKPRNSKDVVHSASQGWAIPTVILLSDYTGIGGPKTNFNRRTLRTRDGNRCQYCAKRLGNEWTIDHVLPRAQGGLTTWTNCVIACVACNSKKANRTPEQAGMHLLTVPKKPDTNLIPLGRRICEDWKHFLSAAYYEVELENDNINADDEE